MSNNAPKRQHYLPCCYLKFFSHDGKYEDSRNTCVWFTDGKISKCVPVNHLGAEDFTYSKEFPQFDRKFNAMEKDYPVLVEKILAKGKLTQYESYRLIMIMIVLKSS